MELPAYRWPSLRSLAHGLYERAVIFIKRVGGIILAVTVLLWFLSTYPAPPEGAPQRSITYSLAGQLGRLLEVLVAPIGFNWQIAIALVPGMAAREVAVGAHWARCMRCRPRGRSGQPARVADCAELVAGHGAVAAGVVCVCAAVHLHHRRRAARDEQLALPAADGGYLFGWRMPPVCDLPNHFGPGRWRVMGNNGSPV